MLQALRRDLDGSCRTDAWDLVAQVLEGRAGAHLAAGRPPQALALRLLVLQVRRPKTASHNAFVRRMGCSQSKLIVYAVWRCLIWRKAVAVRGKALVMRATV